MVGITMEVLLLGKWTGQGLEALIRDACQIVYTQERIQYISSRFLSTPYKEHTLIGDVNTPEVFVINLEGVDCFTYIEYVEALRRCNSFIDFKDKLRGFRYRDGDITFQRRNHFFTDWPIFNPDALKDVTCKTGGKMAVYQDKLLNKKVNDTLYLAGLPVTRRRICYIPGCAIEKPLAAKLTTGDYIGIYATQEGLDVSHVGILIREGDKVYLRHASSRQDIMRVVDEDFFCYVSEKPGIIVLRPV